MPKMRAYRVSGTFPMGMVKNQKFSKEVLGSSKEEAIERIYSELGSKHKIKRRFIKIEDVREIKSEDVQDPVIKYLMERS